MTITDEILPSAPEREIKNFLPVDIAQENVPEKNSCRGKNGGGASSSGIMKLIYVRAPLKTIALKFAGLNFMNASKLGSDSPDGLHIVAQFHPIFYLESLFFKQFGLLRSSESLNFSPLKINQMLEVVAGRHHGHGKIRPC